MIASVQVDDIYIASSMYVRGVMCRGSTLALTMYDALIFPRNFPTTWPPVYRRVLCWPLVASVFCRLIGMEGRRKQSQLSNAVTFLVVKTGFLKTSLDGIERNRA